VASFKVVVDDSRPASASLVGELDLAARDACEGVLSPLVGSPDSLELDLSKLSFIDSSGLGMLLRLHDAAEEAGGRLVLRNPQPQTVNLLTMTDLDSKFVVVTD